MDDDPLGRNLLLALGAGSYFCLMFVWFSLPAYLTAVIADLGLTGTQAGILAGAVPLTYVPLALLTGVVVDRVGPRIAIGAALAVFGGAQVLRAVAGGFVAMLLSTLLVGVGATGITFGLPKLVADLFRQRRIGTASSVYLVGSYLGTAAAFGLGRPVIGPALGGWRNLFLASGVAALAYAVLWGVAAAWSARHGVAAEEAGGDGSTAFTLGSVREDVAAVVAHREIRLLVVGAMYLFVAHGLQGWIVTIFEVRGVAPAVAGTGASVFVAAQLTGTLLVPALADRWDRRREGVVPERRGDAVADRLLDDDLFSKWGLRTLSADDDGYSPVSYHAGGVWPHDNALVALGLSRYERPDAVESVVERQLDALSRIDGRSAPELFGGFDDAASPVSYPSACRPQVWAAAAPFAFLRALFDLEPAADAPRAGRSPDAFASDAVAPVIDVW
jgi:MFS family permease